MIRQHFTVLVFSVDNVFGIDNIYTYRYSADGMRRQAVGPEANRPCPLVPILVRLS